MYLNDFFLADTARRAGFIEQRGTGNPKVTGLEYDSRKVQAGNLYFALRGLHTDGHAYIGAALKRGASVVVHEAETNAAALRAEGVPEQTLETAVFIRVKDSRFAMSPIAAAYHGFPAERLTLIGVTGTEGKSTTVYLIWQLLRLAGAKAGFISTVQYSDGLAAEWNPEHQTTPEATTIHFRLAQMLRNGAEYAVIESSSHGLSPRTNRLGDAAFDSAVMTNVTHEHLEFHGSWEQYRDDKANLFRSLDRRAAGTEGRRTAPFGVLNADDKSAAYFASATRQKTVSFSASGTNAADIKLRSLESAAGGNRYTVYGALRSKPVTVTIEDKLPGAFNAGNVLAALLVVSGLLDIPVEELAPLVPSLEPVRGRMTNIARGQSFEVLVDYAHTPSSFQTIFPPLRSRLNTSGGRIISLFGSAGERDTQKRSEQGMIAARYSDIVVLTDEDPRGEIPMTILEAIAAGCERAAFINSNTMVMKRDETLFLIPDRKAAIRKAFSLARAGDLVLLLGKGHENSIIYKDITMSYDEIAEAEQALDEVTGAAYPESR